MILGKVKYLDFIEDSDTQKTLSSSSVKSNFIDNEIFESALEDCKNIKTKIKHGEQKTPFFNQLSKDIFSSFYKVRPEIYNKDNVYKSLELENNLLKQIINNEKFDNLRLNTSGDIFNSTLALSLFQDKAASIIEEWEKEDKNKESMKKINQAILKQQQLDKVLEELQYDEDNEYLEEISNELKEEVELANQAIDNNKQDVASYNNLSNKLLDSLKKIDKETTETADAIRGLGLSSGEDSSSNSFSSTTFKDKIKIVDALKKNATFKKMAEELGRIKDCIGKVGKKSSKYGQVICDIGNGNDIRKVLSTEKVKLFDEKLELDFYKRYSEKTLLEYKTMGIEDFKGPIVVCLDSSGSMNEGNKEAWAKAVAIATLQLAIEQKRSYRCILFCTYVIATLDFEDGELDIDKMLKLTDVEPTGGTSFEEPLIKALESIEDSKFKKADILFITDGYPFKSLSEKFKDKFNLAKENKGFKVQSILIEETNDKYLKEFSDDITLLSKLNSNEELSNIFENMKYSQ